MKNRIQSQGVSDMYYVLNRTIGAACMLTAIAGAACAAQDPPPTEQAATAESMVWDDVPLTAEFDALLAEAQASQAMADEIGVLQAGGWSGEGAASYRAIQDAHRTRGLARAFSHTSDVGMVTLDLRFVPDPVTGVYGAAIIASDTTREILSQTLSDVIPLETAGSDEIAAHDGRRLAASRSALTAVLPRSCGYLHPGEGLFPGFKLSSCNGLYHLDMQGDGNLVAYTRFGEVVWASGTNGHRAEQVIMQSDGNLVIYFTDREPWATHTTGQPGDRNGFFRMQDDGNLVVYNAGSLPRWSSDTWCEVGVRGHACKLRQCGYVTQIRAGDIVHCGSTPGMFSYDRILRWGHVGALDQGLYADRFGVGQTCPVPNHFSFQTNICGHAPGH